MRTIELKLYAYSELSEEAQKKARDWYRKASAGDNDYADGVIDDVKEIAPLIGLEIAENIVVNEYEFTEDGSFHGVAP